MHVLVIKTSSMGDILHTLPALTDAMNAQPSIRFDWVVEEGFQEIPLWHPAVERVIPIAIRRWRKAWFSASVRQERLQFKKQLAHQHYDLVIDAQGLLKSAYLVAQPIKSKKHGYDWQSCREPLASLFYQVKHRVPKNQHAVERIRQLFKQSIGYPLPYTQGDYGITAKFKSPLISTAAPYLVFLHSTTRADKHWVESYWRMMIEQVSLQGFQVKLPWGTAQEHERAWRLAANNAYVEVLPQSTLSELAFHLAGASAIISVDTGLSHLAAALDRPNITLYGPTDPALIGGYGKHQIVCKAPMNDLSSLMPETVMARLQHILMSCA